jgi:NADH dehydrogenase
MGHPRNATPPRRRVVIVGGGFAGINAARRLGRLTKRGVDVVLINPTDYFLYLPLLPEVTAGILDPRRISVSLRSACPHAQLLLALSTTSTSPIGGSRTSTRKATGRASTTTAC